MDSAKQPQGSTTGSVGTASDVPRVSGVPVESTGTAVSDNPQVTVVPSGPTVSHPGTGDWPTYETAGLPTESPAEGPSGATSDQRAGDGHPNPGLPGNMSTESSSPLISQSSPTTTGRLTAQKVYGGVKIGSAFFGWLTATGLTVMLTAAVIGAGTAVGISTDTTVAEIAGSTNQTTAIGVAGTLALLIILAISYLAGGYVAGRMARFHGIRQGVATWLWAVVIALVVAAITTLAGARYDVLARLNTLPRVPVGGGTLSTLGTVTLVLALVISLVGAVIGAQLGMRFHRRVDELEAMTPQMRG